MVTQKSLRQGAVIASYIAQDQRMKLPIEQSLCVLIHNILTTPMPMYEIAAWLAPLAENALGLNGSKAECIQDDRMGQALERFYQGAQGRLLSSGSAGDQSLRNRLLADSSRHHDRNLFRQICRLERIRVAGLWQQQRS
jgi:hypothetical protein